MKPFGRTKYIVKKEKLIGEWYWMIYIKGFWCDTFIQRCNSQESCKERLKELRNPKDCVIELNDM